MIVQFYGMFKVEWGVEKQTKGNKRYLVVMENLFKNFQIGTRFDLKGSSAGRQTLKGGMDLSSVRDVTIALKDNDFRHFMPKLKIVE